MSEKQQVKLLKKDELAQNTMLFTLEKPAGFDYKAGQTIDLTLPTNGEVSLTHTFSLITAPHEELLSVATRIRDSEYKKVLKDLEEGSTLEIEGPYGSFALHSNQDKSAVFLVGGIGIAPFVSMIRNAKENALPHKLYLLYSNRSPKDTAFLDELREQAESASVHLTFIPTMTDVQDSAQLFWEGETGYINWDMVKKHVPVTSKTIYYMAGPQGMVTAMRNMLSEHGVDEDSIRFEEFPGY